MEFVWGVISRGAGEGAILGVVLLSVLEEYDIKGDECEDESGGSGKDGGAEIRDARRLEGRSICGSTKVCQHH